MVDNLFKRSVQIILQNQAPSGAYIASPNFPTYAYCWLRDGTYIAHAIGRAGHPESAEAFFRWVDRTIKRHAGKVERVVAYQAVRRPLNTNEFLHTRYNLDGSEVTGVEWSNFQIDGYSTWLWGLVEHVARTGERSLLVELAESVRLAEQILQHTLAPGYLPEWERRWGPVACPLLWSHAKYLILRDVLKP